jgi:hypothetical protein
MTCGVGEPKMGAEMFAMSQMSPARVSKRMDRLRVVRPVSGPAGLPTPTPKRITVGTRWPSNTGRWTAACPPASP